ncbi:MAG: aspartate aminotransferase family protein [Bacteroidia bacterium]
MQIRSLFLKHLAQTNPEPIGLAIDHAEGMYLYDNNGNKYIDLIAGISVSNVGHQHPDVLDAVKNQIDRNMHVMVYGEVIHDQTVKYAHWICSNMSPNLNSVYFVNSGSEATDTAMKLAKRYTKKSGFVAQNDSYHGSSQGPLSLMNDSYFTERYKPLLNGIYYINQNNLEELIDIQPSRIAAVVMELIQSERGALSATLEFVRYVREWCTKNNILLIVDEIQTGFYRTGKPFAYMHYGIQPDVILLGKALGGGMPMGAVVASEKIMSSFTRNPILGHITTFGGHPVVAAAGFAANNWVFQNIKQLKVEEKSQLFKELLVHQKIKTVEGRGLLLACHLTTDINIVEFNQKLLAKRIFTDWFLFNMNAIRIAPPLIISNEEIKWVCKMILDTLNEYD